MTLEREGVYQCAEAIEDDGAARWKTIHSANATTMPAAHSTREPTERANRVGDEGTFARTRRTGRRRYIAAVPCPARSRAFRPGT
jgi:hypothetical protein